MQQVIIAIHLMVVTALVVLVLYQKSEGGALGMGQSGLFTGRGQANALTRATGVLATIFFLTSIALTVLPAWERRAEGGADWTKAIDQKIELKEIPAKPDAAKEPAAPGAPADGKESIFEQLQRAQQKRQGGPAEAPPAAEPEKPGLRPSVDEPKTQPEGKAPEAAPTNKEPSAGADAPKADAPKVEAPKVESPMSEPSKSEAPKTEAPTSAAPKAETPKGETPKSETPKSEPTPEAPKAGASGDAKPMDAKPTEAPAEAETKPVAPAPPTWKAPTQ